MFFGSALKERAALFVTMFIVPLVCLFVVVTIVTAVFSVNNNIRSYERIFVYYIDEMDTSLNYINVYLVNTIQRNQIAADLIYNGTDKEYDLNIRKMYLQLNQDRKSVV
jgi:uncharacterized membrane protein